MCTCFFAGMRLLCEHTRCTTFMLVGIVACMVLYHQVDQSSLMEAISDIFFSKQLKDLIIAIQVKINGSCTYNAYMQAITLIPCLEDLPALVLFLSFGLENNLLTIFESSLSHFLFLWPLNRQASLLSSSSCHTGKSKSTTMGLLNSLPSV